MIEAMRNSCSLLPLNFNYMKFLPKIVAPLGAVALLLSVFSSCKKSETFVQNDGARPDDRGVAHRAPVSGSGALADGLIAYWPLDACVGAFDMSGNGHHGNEYSTSYTTDRFGDAGAAFEFDGSTSYIEVGDHSDLRLNNTDFTLTAWVQLDSYNSSFNSAIMTKRFTGANNGWIWSVTGNGSSPTGVLFYGPGGGSTNATGSVTVGTGNWYMATSVYNLANQELSIYVNGTLDRVVGGISSANASITANLYIGRDDPSTFTNGYFFDGAMDDIRIYNRAITVSEIQQLYALTLAPTSGVIALWPLNICTGGIGVDISGNGHHGTAYNMSPGTDRFGNTIGAGSFNGSNSYIDVPDQSALRLGNTDFTLNAWVQLNSYNWSFNSAILTKRYTGFNNGWIWSVTGNGSSPTGVVFYGPGGGSSNATGSTSLGTGSWYMVTSVYDLANQTLSIYINGTLDRVVSSISPANAAITANLYIGRDDPSTFSNGYFFDGILDDIRIYNRAVSYSEIQQLFTAVN